MQTTGKKYQLPEALRRSNRGPNSDSDDANNIPDVSEDVAKLVAAVNERLAAQNMSVTVGPTASTSAADAQAGTSKRGRGRPKKQAPIVDSSSSGGEQPADVDSDIGGASKGAVQLHGPLRPKSPGRTVRR